MDTIFMNSKNRRRSDPRRLKRSDKHVAQSNLSICYTSKNIKKSCKSNKFEVSAPTWNEEFELLDGSYFISY